MHDNKNKHSGGVSCNAYSAFVGCSIFLFLWNAFCHCRLFEMDNSHNSDDDSANIDDSSSFKDHSNTLIDESSIISDASKRKLLEAESPASSMFKKARYSWQVKGSKEKNNEASTEVLDDSLQNIIPETSDLNTVQPASGSVQPDSDGAQPDSDSIDQVGQTSNFSNQHQFHAMDFDPPSASQTDCQRDHSSFHSTIPIPQEQTDILSSSLGNTSRTNPDSLTNPPRIKHVSTSLHTCFLTSRPTNSDIINDSVPLDNVPVVPSIANAIPNLPSSSVSVMSPNNATGTNTSSNNDVRERIEFRDALRSMHRSNMSAYEKWQKRNTAGAIVDNVFNRTLEEMGISPDAASNRRSLDRSAVENQSILAAISSQGLTANRNERTESSATESSAERSDMQDDFDYLRQNRDVFDRTFERLGYMRYDIIHQHIPNTQTVETNTGFAQDHVQMEDLATQTNDNTESSQSNEDSGSCIHDNASDQSGISHLETDVVVSKEYRAELNISIENIATSSIDPESDDTPYKESIVVNADKSRDNNVVKEVSRDNETKEKDVGVSENVLNLALSAAIQSQGLTLK